MLQDNWWEKDQVATPAPTGPRPSAAPVFVPGVKQIDPIAVERLGIDQRNEQRQITKDVRDASMDALQQRKAELDIQKTEADLAKSSGKKSGDELRSAQTELLNVINAAQRAKRLSQEGWFATGFGANTASGVGGTSAADVKGLLNTIGANTAFSRLQKMRDESPTGGALGGIAIEELRMLRDTIASIDQSQSDEQFQANMERIVKAYADAYRRLAGDDEQLQRELGVVPGSERRDDGASGVVPGASPPPSDGAPGGTGEGPGGAPLVMPGQRTEVQVSTAPQRFATPEDQRFAAILQSVLDRGGSVDEANKLAVQYGRTKEGSSFIDPNQWNNAIRYNRTRPKGAPKAEVEVPQSGFKELSKTEQVVGNLAASPAGALITGAANTLALPGIADEVYGGINSLVTGKPLDQSIAEMNFRKGLIRNENPGSYLAGEIAGGVGSQLGAARLIPALRSGGVLSPGAVAADAAYGAAYGAGEQNEDRLGGAALGALSGAGGGIAGRGIGKSAAGIIAPQVPDDVRALTSRGVRLTPGQAIGPRAAATEEKLASLPVVGDLIRGGRERSIKDFNRTVLNEALSPIGKTLPAKAEGTAAMRYGQKAFDDAYDDARAGMRVAGDRQMVDELSALRDQVQNGALDEAAANRLQKIYDAHVARRLKGGGMTGEDYKKTMSALGKLQAGARKTNMELADAIGDLRTILDGAARRSSPAEAVAKLDAADQGYALWIRAETAAAMRAGDTATFSPSQLDSAVQKADGSVRSKAYLRGDARGQNLAEAGKNVLRDTIPNSGTIDRGLATGGLAGLAYLEPSILAAAGGLGAVYSPGVRDAIVKAITRESPAKAKKIAEMIRRRQRMIGAGTSPLALVYAAEE